MPHTPAVPGQRAALVALLVAYLLLAWVYVLSVPPWEAPDEPAHYRRVRSLSCAAGLERFEPGACNEPTVFGRAATWSIHATKEPPRCEEVSQAPARRFGGPRVWSKDYLLRSYQKFQPPLGHMAWVPWFFLTGPMQPPIFVNAGYPSDGPGVFLHELDTDAAMESSIRDLRTLRGFAMLVGLLTVLAAWKCGAALAPDQPGVALAAGSLVAFLPQFTFASAYVNNDVVAAAAGAWLTLVIVRRVVRSGPISLTWLTGALALLLLAVGARPNAAGLAGFALLGLLMVIEKRQGRGAMLSTAGAVAGLALLGLVAIRFFFEPFWITWSGHFHARLLGGDKLTLLEAIRGMSRSLIGVFGWMDVALPPAAYVSAGILALLLAGSVAFQVPHPAQDARRKPAVLLLAAGALLIGIPALLNAQAVGQAQGRYLFPALGALAALGGLGACGFASPRRGFRAAALLAVLLCAGNLTAVLGGLRPAYADAPRGRLTRQETSDGPLLLQHGPAEGRSVARGLPPDEKATWAIGASEQGPVDVTLTMKLMEANRRRLLEPILEVTSPSDPEDLPGVARVESTGPGASPGARVKPQWMTIGGERRRALAAHPTTRLMLDPVTVPDSAHLEVRFGIDERVWDQSVDGVSFRILAKTPGRPEELLLERLVDPASEAHDRGWLEETVELDGWSGREVTLVLETLPGPRGNSSHDWAAWEAIDLVVSPIPRTFHLCDESVGRLLDPSQAQVALGPGEWIQIRLATSEGSDVEPGLILIESSISAATDL